MKISKTLFGHLSVKGVQHPCFTQCVIMYRLAGMPEYGTLSLIKHLPLPTKCGGVTVDEKLPLSLFLLFTWLYSVA